MAHLATQVHFWPRIQDSWRLSPLMVLPKVYLRIYFTGATLLLWANPGDLETRRLGRLKNLALGSGPIFRLEISF